MPIPPIHTFHAGSTGSAGSLGGSSRTARAARAGLRATGPARPEWRVSGRTQRFNSPLRSLAPPPLLLQTDAGGWAGAAVRGGKAGQAAPDQAVKANFRAAGGLPRTGKRSSQKRCKCLFFSNMRSVVTHN
jgi:hypothetical protein